jgi:flagellar hook-basal body complex protein FliE
MDISTNSLYAQMQSMSLEASGNRISSMQNGFEQSNSIKSVNNSGSDFGNLLKSAVDNLTELQKDAGDKRTAFEMGDRSVTLAQSMVAAQKAGLAFSATMQVRNKFVEAYKEIMSMPV